MTSERKIISLALFVLLAATVYGLVRTSRDSGIPASIAIQGAPGQNTAVDQTPLLTARALAEAPTSTAEQPFAQEALRLGDQEMDLAFALAVSDATQHPPVLTAAAKKVEAQLDKAENTLAAQQAQVTQLTAAVGSAVGARKNALSDQLDLATARLELAQDEVDADKQELDQAGGDPQDRIQAMVQEHEASSKISDSTKINVSTPIQPHGLIQRIQQWSALHQKRLQISSARTNARSTAEALSTRYYALAQQFAAHKDQSSTSAASSASPPASVAGNAAPPTSGEAVSPQESASMAKTTRERAADQKTISTLAKRIDNETQLQKVYGNWIQVVAAEQRSIVNGGLRGILLILMIAIVGLFFDGWLGHVLGKISVDRRRIETLRTVTRVALQIVGVLLILLVIFGRPGQLGTFLGLAGAGLTVALKDFIIAFLGWFVLMGKNGIRLGDWVEVNGVTGEVVELGMFHTVLLETGNWTDSGHPTGRRVTFTNGFAVEGHYFNFSTSGQWLWDELQIVLPAGQNPYPVVEAIEKKVIEATSESASQAEQEWQHAAKSRALHTLSAAPAINVKPVVGGTEISVRYITRANQRSELRAKLNHEAVDLLGAAGNVKPASDSPTPAFTSK